jgi:hypothetical protein
MSEKDYLGWGDVAPKDEQESTKKVDYLWLKSGQKYKIRPVHKPVHIFKYFYRNSKNELHTAICANPDTCPVAAEHTDLAKPSSRYAIYVFDRNDDNKLKVMEGPKTVFLPFRERFQATDKDPGGSTTGGDWQINITGTGKNTKYSLIYIEDVPLTASEKSAVSELITEESSKLVNIYKPHTQEEMEKRLFEPFPSKDGSSDSGSETSSTPAPAPTAQTGASASESDDFDMNW